MEIKGKVHLMFEQSGTFKQEFIKLGYESYDYDIQNNFGQTDFQIDLFKEIENAYDGMESVFDNITKDDLIMAFFPCIYFESQKMMYFSNDSLNIKKMPLSEKHQIILQMIDIRNYFYTVLYKMFFVCERMGLRIVLENPATQPNFILFTQNFYVKPTIIDRNRQLRGDYFKKPTAYWFLNCEPTNGHSYQKPKETKTVQKSKEGKSAGICSEERSLISPDYARNLICDFIIGKEQNHTQLDLFKCE